MGKISPVSAKYIVQAVIEIDGAVDKPDVIGAIFGQTEGLLGSELELRELQKSGRIGRIEVNIDTRGGKSKGDIIIPSSLDKAETAIVAAALEVIERIGPCTAKIKVQKIEDVRVAKRGAVVERAKQLLRQLMDTSIPDSQELADEVAYSVRVMEIQEYGKDRLPAGPAVDESEEIIIVEGRADVLALLKHGFKNVIAMNGTSVPETIIDLCREKVVTVFVDGDRGGELIVRSLMNATEIDFVTKAPDGKEVEELAKKEIHKALRARISTEQAALEMAPKENRMDEKSPYQRQRPFQREQREASSVQRRPRISTDEKGKFKTMAEDLIGTKGAYILDNKLNILGKVPMTELASTIKSIGQGVYAVIFDGEVDKDLLDVAERSRIQFLIGMDSKVSSAGRVNVLTAEEL